MALVERTLTDGVLVVVINRPERRNALNYAVRDALYELLLSIEGDKSIRAMVITGKGEAFVSGADIAPMESYTPDDAERASQHGSLVFSMLERLPFPVIAAINGWALGGGCELALACDIRICSEKARFGQPEIRLGLIPGYGAPVRLPRVVGVGHAKDLIFTGRIITAEEAYRIGLVTQVVRSESLMNAAMQRARQFANGPAALQLAKRAINETQDLDTGPAMELASRLYGTAYLSEDVREGIRAYLEKRKPAFTGE